MEDLRNKVKGKRSFLEKIMNYIPLYHGYKQKELRRESDRLLRNYAHQILSDTKTTLKNIQQVLVEHDKISEAKKLDKFITKFETVSQKINHAEAGYSGFWDVDKIKENDLDKLYEIDSTISEYSNDAKSLTQNLLDKISKSFTISDSDISLISEKLQTIEEQISIRKNFLQGMIE